MNRAGIVLAAGLALGCGAAEAAAGPGGAPGGAGAFHAPPVAAQPTPTAPSPTRAVGQPQPAFRPATPTDPIAARYSADYEGCMHKAGSTLDMVTCADRENDRWDARMNRALQVRLGGVNDRQRAALKRAQKAWIEFRDADCAASDEDGSIARIDASQCVLRRTVERTLELEAYPADHGPG